MTSNNKLTLPAHPFNGRLQSGIDLRDGKAVIINKGNEVLSRPLLESTTPWQFWHDLKFAEVFPDVSHWWFYSGWTQQVRLRVASRQGESLNGFMQFVSDESVSQMWFYDAGEISVPFPSGEENAGNLPLRLVLSRLVCEMRQNRLMADQWYVVTSLVEASQVAEMFPVTWTHEWWLAGMADKNRMRDYFCFSLGLKPGN
ncbi:MAG: hypothetical protein GY803_22295 [Chloroflexi bacterium]|nr:hypothetical protein [Chloroflexota bacterium]